MENTMEEYLKILDDLGIQSKEHFILACATAGLTVDDAKIQEIIQFEINTLKTIGKLKNMFDTQPVESFFAYRKFYHLVVKTEILEDDFQLRELHIRYIKDMKARNYKVTLNIFDDLAAKFKTDADDELWYIIQYEALKR